MAKFTSAKALADHQRARGLRVKRSVQAALAHGMDDVKAEARRLVSGGTSTATLRRLNHPFGHGPANRRGPRGTHRLLPINAQTGRLRSSLRLFHYGRSGGDEWRVQFTAPHSKFVLRPGGTALMRDRQFWAAMKKFSRPRVVRYVTAAKRRAEK